MICYTNYDRLGTENDGYFLLMAMIYPWTLFCAFRLYFVIHIENCVLVLFIIFTNFQKFVMQQQHFRFIYCVEHLVEEGQYTNWEACFQQTGFGSKPVIDCYNSGYGDEVGLHHVSH